MPAGSSRAIVSFAKRKGGDQIDGIIDHNPTASEHYYDQLNPQSEAVKSKEVAELFASFQNKVQGAQAVEDMVDEIAGNPRALFALPRLRHFRGKILQFIKDHELALSANQKLLEDNLRLSNAQATAAPIDIDVDYDDVNEYRQISQHMLGVKDTFDQEATINGLLPQVNALLSVLHMRDEMIFGSGILGGSWSYIHGLAEDSDDESAFSLLLSVCSGKHISVNSIHRLADSTKYESKPEKHMSIACAILLLQKLAERHPGKVTGELAQIIVRLTHMLMCFVSHHFDQDVQRTIRQIYTAFEITNLDSVLLEMLHTINKQAINFTGYHSSFKDLFRSYDRLKDNERRLFVKDSKSVLVLVAKRVHVLKPGSFTLQIKHDRVLLESELVTNVIFDRPTPGAWLRLNKMFRRAIDDLHEDRKKRHAEAPSSTALWATVSTNARE